MKIELVSTNRNSDNYGYPRKLEYETNGEWYGHSFGVAIALINPETKTILKNFLDPSKFPDEEIRNEKALEIINSNMVLLNKKLYQHNPTTNKMDMQLLYFMPYMIPKSSKHMQTVNNSCINEHNATGHYEVTIETLIMHPEDGDFKRYALFKINTKNTGLYSLVQSIFETDRENHPDIFISDKNADEFTIAFYNTIGDEQKYKFDNYESALNCVNSMRIVDLKFIDK